MNADKNVVRTVVETGLRQAMSQFESANSGDMLSDIYIKIDLENGKLLIFDDMENLLSENNIEVWEDDQNQDAFAGLFLQTTKPVIQDLHKEGLFEKEYIFKPFSINLVDDNFILVEELFFLDDDTLKLDGESLLDLDKELDDFLQNLMKDF